ncbi:MAG: hypothetical protein ACRD5R_18595 [Candidatus Acidiferrales bacterium]
MGHPLDCLAAETPCCPRFLFLRIFVFVFALLPILMIAGCRRAQPLDTAALDNSGMNYDVIKQLKALRITPAEVTEIATARQAGFPDASCLEIVKIYRAAAKPFDVGDAVAGLVQAGMTNDDILELARMNQLGLDVGELQAIRLLGLPDAVVLEVARQRQHGTPVLSGASLGRLKNTGMRADTLLALVQRGVPDSEANAIISARRHGLSDAQILRHFAPAK